MGNGIGCGTMKNEKCCTLIGRKSMDLWMYRQNFGGELDFRLKLLSFKEVEQIEKSF